MTLPTTKRPYFHAVDGLLTVEDAGGHVMVTVDRQGLDGLIKALKALKGGQKMNTVVVSTEEGGTGLAVRCVV